MPGLTCPDVAVRADYLQVNRMQYPPGHRKQILATHPRLGTGHPPPGKSMASGSHSFPLFLARGFPDQQHRTAGQGPPADQPAGELVRVEERNIHQH